MASFSSKVSGKPSPQVGAGAGGGGGGVAKETSGGLPTANPKPNNPTSNKERPCFAFQTDSCSRGDSCKYGHFNDSNSNSNGSYNSNSNSNNSNSNCNSSSNRSSSGGGGGGRGGMSPRSPSGADPAPRPTPPASSSSHANPWKAGLATSIVPPPPSITAASKTASSSSAPPTTATTTTTTTTSSSSSTTTASVAAVVSAVPSAEGLFLVTGGPLSEPRKKTEGVQAKHMDTIRETNRPRGGVLLLGDSLTERLFTDGKARLIDLTKRNVFVAGCGGDNIQNTCWRVQKGIVRATGAEHIIVFIGTNNIGSTPLDDFRPLYINLLAAIRRDAPLARISCLGCCGRSDLGSDQLHLDYVESVNVIQKQVCDEFGVEFHGPFIERYERELFKDHIHFSPRGFDRMVNYIISILKK